MRRLPLLLVVTLAMTWSAPARATGPVTTFGVMGHYAGFILVTTAPSLQPDLSAQRAYALCEYQVAFTSATTMAITYSGAGWVSLLPAPARMPQQVIIECRVENHLGDVAMFRWYGGAVVHSQSTVLNWPITSIRTCARVEVFYGPANPVHEDTGLHCNQ
jgi:hypothetical protein